jgi:signal transduction histidine kinase
LKTSGAAGDIRSREAHAGSIEQWGTGAVAPSALQTRGRARTLVVGGRPVRVLAAPAPVADTIWAIEIGVPIGEFYEALDNFAWMVVLVSPLLLLVASAGGYWMSRRALEPVDRITRTARAIGAENLAERLPLRGADDELDRLSGTLNDMFARLDAAFRRVTQFTADASHELRTPVAIIRTTAELTRRRPRTDAGTSTRSIGSSAKANGRHASSTISCCLRAPTPREKSSRSSRWISPRHFERRATRDATGGGRGPVILARGEVRLSGAGRSSGAEAAVLDPARQCCEHTAPGGAVSVRLDAGLTDAMIEVRDNGVGIGAEDLPHVFERFYRVGKDRSRAKGGVGLGLSIAQRIATAHGGDISVQSEPGSGSTVRVRLPIVSPSS